MKYEKPEVNTIANAHESIQGGKAAGTPLDGIQPFEKTTVNAYEADE